MGNVCARRPRRTMWSSFRPLLRALPAPNAAACFLCGVLHHVHEGTWPCGEHRGDFEHGESHNSAPGMCASASECPGLAASWTGPPVLRLLHVACHAGIGSWVVGKDHAHSEEEGSFREPRGVG